MIAGMYVAQGHVACPGHFQDTNSISYRSMAKIWTGDSLPESDQHFKADEADVEQLQQSLDEVYVVACAYGRQC